MFEYSKGYHWRWGWDGVDYARPSPTSKLHYTFGRCSRPVMSFREECLATAKYIAEISTKPIQVFLSGGQDSQVVCLAFHLQKIPIRAVTISWHGDGQSNSHDVANAVTFCSKHNIPHEIISADVSNQFDFWQNELIERGIHAVRDTPLFPRFESVARDYTTIFGSQIPLIMTDAQNFKLGYQWSGSPHQQYLLDKQLDGVVAFFYYSPELISSILNDCVTDAFEKAYQSIFPLNITEKYSFTAGLDNLTGYTRSFYHVQFIMKPLIQCRNWPELVHTVKYEGYEQFSTSTRLLNMWRQIISIVQVKTKDMKPYTLELQQWRELLAPIAPAAPLLLA